MNIKKLILGVCFTAFSVQALAGGCADIVRAADRVVTIRNAGVQQNMLFASIQTEISGDSHRAALYERLSELAYRYPMTDGNTLAGMLVPECSRDAHPEVIAR